MSKRHIVLILSMLSAWTVYYFSNWSDLPGWRMAVVFIGMIAYGFFSGVYYLVPGSHEQQQR